MTNTYECRQCGKCCKNIVFIPEDFPYKVNNGICSMLENNKCLIYEKRPFICNIDQGYEAFKTLNPELKRAQWYAMNKQFCEKR